MLTREKTGSGLRYSSLNRRSAFEIGQPSQNFSCPSGSRAAEKITGSEIRELVPGPASALTDNLPVSVASVSPTVKWGWLYLTPKRTD